MKDKVKTFEDLKKENVSDVEELFKKFLQEKQGKLWDNFINKLTETIKGVKFIVKTNEGQETVYLMKYTALLRVIGEVNLSNIQIYLYEDGNIKYNKYTSSGKIKTGEIIPKQ